VIDAIPQKNCFARGAPSPFGTHDRQVALLEVLVIYEGNAHEKANARPRGEGTRPGAGCGGDTLPKEFAHPFPAEDKRK
jgi:hypothetical protein